MRKNRSIFWVAVVLFIITACENDLEMINSFSTQEDTAMHTMKNSEIVYTDSGLIRLKITAPAIKHFPQAKEPYVEFPEGVHTIFFDYNQQPESELKAKYAIYFTQLGLWEARDSVEVINKEGEILNTDQLFWNEKEKKIYTNTFVKITRQEEIIRGEGFESNENFTRWRIRNIHGEIYLKDE